MKRGKLVDEKEFLTKIEQIDEYLGIFNISVYSRPLIAFWEFNTGYEGVLWGTDSESIKQMQNPYEGVNLLEKIEEWYIHRYGEERNFRQDIGIIPVLIRNEVYSIRIPKIYSNCNIDVLKLIERITEDMVANLRDEEIDKILIVYELGANFFYAIDFQIMETAEENEIYITRQSMELIKRGVEDIRTSIYKIIRKPGDYQDCCFHSQQAVEKFLKGYLCAFKTIDEREFKKIYGHNTKSLFEKMMGTNPLLKDLGQEITKIDYSMDVRYKDLNISIAKAMDSIYSCIMICYFILKSIYKFNAVVTPIVD